ncbi:MAG: hypothetical protein JO127_10035 [Caulobacteraceae bacterium]|nr:hypothetical protein [Caulobacteraceae bacterium]
MLTFFQKLEVGEYCEREWDKCRGLRELEQINNYRLLQRQQRLLKDLDGLSPRQRRLKFGDPIQMERLSRKAFGGRRPEYVVKSARPYGRGLKGQIMEAAINDCLARYGVWISPRMVETCWKLFREIEREARSGSTEEPTKDDIF